MRLVLEKRAEASGRMAILSPLIAIVLTLVTGGIIFTSTASSGSKYSVKAGAPAGTPAATSYGTMPVLFTSWFSAARFANWLENGQQTIPMWMWGLVAFLGHQEFIYVVTSPVLLIFIVVIGYVFFRNWITLQYQRFQESGPPGLVAAVNTVVAIAKPIALHLQEQANSRLQQGQPTAVAQATAKKNQ